MQKILLSGGSGMIGNHLENLLKSKNYEVAILSRSKSHPSIGVYNWDPPNNKIDEHVFENCTAVVHLAGAGIADKPWTPNRKKEILESRVNSSRLLFETLKNTSHQVKTVISASAIGIYGNGGEQIKNEESRLDKGFLQDTCVAWENEVKRIGELGIRVVILRIGVVLYSEGGAFPQMARPVKLFLGAPLGSGEQYISWIHIDDLNRIILYAIENEKVKGVYNAVASNPVTNNQFYKVLAGELNKPLWPLNVPSFLLKILLGEKAEIVLSGQRVSNNKLLETGFEFKYKNLAEAIANV